MNKKDIAVFTICKNESYFLPILLNHYKKSGFKNEDIYVLDHESDDGSTENLDVNVRKVFCPDYFNHQWLLEVVEGFQRELLEKYHRVIFAEADEMITSKTNPNLVEYLRDSPHSIIQGQGWDVVGGCWWRKNGMYNKPTITTEPVFWGYGFHRLQGKRMAELDLQTGASTDYRHRMVRDKNLYLVHLHKLNYFEAWKKKLAMSKMNWNEWTRKRSGASAQNRITNKVKFTRFFREGELEDIPDWLIEREVW